MCESFKVGKTVSKTACKFRVISQQDIISSDFFQDIYSQLPFSYNFFKNFLCSFLVTCKFYIF